MHARHGRSGRAVRPRADARRRPRPRRRLAGGAVRAPRRRHARSRLHAPDRQDTGGRGGRGGGSVIGVRGSEMSALFGFAERQVHVYNLYCVWEVVWRFYSVVSVLSIGFLASGLGSLGAGGGSFDLRKTQLYLLIGALLWGYLSLVFMEAAYAIAWERWEGTIEYTFMAPVRRMTHLMGICLFAIVYGLARTFIVLIVAVAIFDLDFSHADIGGALVVLAASLAPLIGLAILTSVLPLLSPQKGEQMSFAVQGFMLLVSGVYYPLTVLPWPLRPPASSAPSPTRSPVCGAACSRVPRRPTRSPPWASCWAWAWSSYRSDLLSSPGRKGVPRRSVC